MNNWMKWVKEMERTEQTKQRQQKKRIHSILTWNKSVDSHAANAPHIAQLHIIVVSIDLYANCENGDAK